MQRSIARRLGFVFRTLKVRTMRSVEYMLAGLPVVSTPSVGGREIYFDHEYCTICDPDPAAVRDAVEALRRAIFRAIYPRSYARQDRARAAAFLSLIDDLSDRLGGQRRYDDGIWPFDATSPLVTWKDYRRPSENFAAADAGQGLGRRPNALDGRGKRYPDAGAGAPRRGPGDPVAIKLLATRVRLRQRIRRSTKAPIATARRRLSRTIPVGRRKLGRGSKRPAFI